MTTHGPKRGGGTAVLERVSVAERGAGRRSSARTTVVTYTSDAARERISRLFERVLTDAEIAGLAGALPGSQVEVGRGGEITVTAPRGRFYSTTFVVPSDPGKTGPSLVNFEFRGKDSTNRIAVSPRVLATQVRQAHALGVDNIHMKGRQHSDDFEQLPQLGYDTTIKVALDESRSQTLPAGVGPVRMLSDLLATRAGAAFWHANGLNPGLDFDPHPGTHSWQTLDALLRSRHMRGLGS